MQLVECRGDGRERGRAHGSMARQQVRAAIKRWGDQVSQSQRLDSLAYADRLLAGTAFVPTIAEWAPDLADEVRGIAEGADVDERLVLAYNLMDEQWWFDLGRDLTPGACSVLVVNPPVGKADGCRILAQNMDLPAYMDGSQIVLHIVPRSGVESLVLSAAGLIGLTGVNLAGVAVCVNTLLMLKHSAHGLPVAFVLRQALTYSSLAEATGFIERVPHASGQQYAVASSGDSVSLEASGVGVTHYRSPGGDSWAHTNHPLASTDADSAAQKTTTVRSRISASVARLRFLDAASRRSPVPVEVKSLLADRTVPICVSATGEHPSETFGSVLFELDEPPRVEMCLGRPDRNDWLRLGWTDDHGKR
jgi:isopenicillin-N N-acyltransferase like protein